MDSSSLFSCRYYKNQYSHSIYAEGVDEGLQNNAQRAREAASKIISSHKDEIPLPVQIASGAVEVAAETSIRAAHDPFIWFYFHSTHVSHHYGGGGCGSCGSCGGGSGSGEGYLIAALIAAIVALVACTGVSIGVTSYQGYHADKTRKKMNSFEGEIEKLQNEMNQSVITKEHRDELGKVIEIYKAMSEIKKEKWRDRSLQTFFTAVIAVGFGLLTTGAALKLYELLYHMPTLSLPQTLAIAGGSTVGTGALAYAVRPLARYALKGERQKSFNRLNEALRKETIPGRDPYSILYAHGADQHLFIKQGKMVYFQDPSRKNPYYEQIAGKSIPKGFREVIIWEKR